MFDFHIHTDISYDGHTTGEAVVEAAVKAGLKEICFTDHLDYDPLDRAHRLDFDTQRYNAAYDHLQAEGLKIRRGCEFGMLTDTPETLQQDLQRRHFDFVIASVHFIDGRDPYLPEFWQYHTVEQAEQRYLETLLECLQLHDDFDVMGHLTYISKTRYNPLKRPIRYETYREIIDEILRTLVRKDKGMEINTSGVDICGVFLPEIEFLRRFKELGGSIVTVGSDAHDARRVGQYCDRAVEMAREVFGYVCTFEDRKPIFHRI